MSLKERDRLAVFSRVRDEQMSLRQASACLGLSYRQTRRVWKRYRQAGDAGLGHGLRGRPSNNQAARDDRRERALALYRRHYQAQGFGPTLAAQQMAERDGLAVNHETLRGWLTREGLWKPSRQPRRGHRRRERRPCFGELVQLDGSDHAWLGAEQKRCCLMVMVDDATGWTQARFFESETTVAVMSIVRQWTLERGLPRTLYPDRHSIYRRNDKAADEIAHRTGQRPLTRFGEAMAELDVEVIWAHSPQAKGRVERMNKTLQDRLVKLLALEGITTLEAANEYLESRFLPAHNARFAVEPCRKEDAHRGGIRVEELDAALCPERERRAVSHDATVSWRGRCWQLRGPDAQVRRRRQVEVRERLDGTVVMRDVSDGRVLASQMLPEAARSKASSRVPLRPRVAALKGPSKPAADHAWRTRAAGGGAGPARGARLPCATPRGSPQGTLLLG
jgi:transposase